MEDLKTIDSELNKYLRLQSFPIALRMLKSEAEIPGKTRRPFAQMKQQVAICQGFYMARKYGWSVAMGKEDMACPPGAAAYGFFKDSAYFDEGNMAFPTYAPSLDLGKSLEADIPRFPYGEYSHILVAPLDKAEFEPQLLIIYAMPAQVMRLIHGAIYEQGHALTAASECRIGCAIVAAVMKSGECTFSVPGNGDRVFGGTQDHEMNFFLPMQRVPGVLAGLAANHMGGTRYPIPAYAMYQPSFPKNYSRQMEIWQENGELAKN